MRRADGAWAERDCVLVQPGHKFENVEGRLRIQMSDRFPGGTWVESARNIRREGDLLFAELQREDLTYVPVFAVVADHHYFKNVDGELRRTEAGCASLGACIKSYWLKLDAFYIRCAALYCDALLDLDTCCDIAMPCSNITSCVYPQISDPNGYCQGMTCEPERDEAVCCKGVAKCDSLPCRYGWVSKPDAADVACETTRCDPELELPLCCEPAARCTALAGHGCPSGLYFNKLEFCAGTECLESRDRNICCQEAMSCESLPCPLGYVARDNVSATYCDGPTCDPERDADACCDAAEPCDTLTCPYGYLTLPDTYCLGTECFPERDLGHCCLGAEPCGGLNDTNCSVGYFFNMTDFCAGVSCDEERDRGLCCQKAAPCSGLGCPFGYIAKPNGYVFVVRDTPPYREYVESLYCEGLACLLARDRDACCDLQASCLALSCPEGFVRAWNASERLCLGPDCVLSRDRDVCCEVAATCSEEYSCPHGYVPKPVGFCDGVSCEAERDLRLCCFDAMPCPNLTCPDNYVQRPNMFCSRAVHEPSACTLETDLDTCCERGMALLWFRFSPLRVKDNRSYQVQLAELKLYFYGERVQGSTLEQGGNASSVDGNYPAKEDPSKAIDANLDTKWLDADPLPRYFPGKVYTFKGLTVQLPSAKPIDSYSFVTGDDLWERDPIEWALEGSPDNQRYVLLHAVADATSSVPETRKLETPKFPIRVPCFAPKQIKIPHSNATYPCLEGSIVASGERCTASCLAGYAPSIAELSCTQGELSPELFTCTPL